MLDYVSGLRQSTYVLTRSIPVARIEVEKILSRIARPGGSGQSHELAALNDMLSSLSATEFSTAVADHDLRSLTQFQANYIAAMVEHTAKILGLTAPQWTTNITPSDEPWFATTLPRLRAHLLRVSPLAFKKRNIFIESTIGARV